MNRLSLAYESPFIGKVKAIHFFITLRKHYLLLLSGKNHEAFQKQLLLSGKNQNRIKSLSEHLYNQGFGLFHDKSKPP